MESDLPNYVMRGSAEEKNWKLRNPKGYKLHEATGITVGATALHQAANIGDIDEMKRLLKDKAHLVNSRDVNGWMPLHVSALRSLDRLFYSCVETNGCLNVVGGCEGR